MFASSTGPRSAARRRGIVLVLVLGMLGLMALIGVTFATFAGQSLKNGRNFSQGVARPQSEVLMDYALAQLINDTNNPLSAIRGHSLLRDMYGNDSVFRGSNPPANSVAETGGLLTSVYDSSIPGYVKLHFTGGGNAFHSTGTVTPFYNQIQYVTNIPTTGQYQGYDFTRWILRFVPKPGAVAQTFEVIEDDTRQATHLFTLSANLGNARIDPTFSNQPLSSHDSTAFNYGDPNYGGFLNGTQIDRGTRNSLAREYSDDGSNNSTYAPDLTKSGTYLATFTLDGRYMRAFNGPGMTRPVQASDSSGNPLNAYPYNQAAYGNMRIANINPDALGMDEDYDACDLENWFLGIQSADGQVMIPSFHRPGILTGPLINDNGLNDWTTSNVLQRAKILRPRQVDNSPLFPADPSVPDSNGKLTFDIDNDGDGITDSVWLDLGYPTQRDPNGKLYKPLFAFMVLGLNGRLPLNTVGNLQARSIGDTTNNAAPAVGFPNISGQIPYPGNYPADATNNRYPHYSSQAFFDFPVYDHTSHLGYSVNEINPKFALQNAPSNVYASSNGLGKTIFAGAADFTNPVSYSQLDDSGISVALTQMRNILAGTILPDLPNPYPTSASLPVSSSAGIVANGDVNIVYVDGQPYILPNTAADSNDISTVINGNSVVSRNYTAVPGRWGEPEGIPKTMSFPNGGPFDPLFPILNYANSVRAGRSIFINGGNSIDGMDDDFDSFDPFLPKSDQYSSTTSVIFTLNKDALVTPPSVYEIPLNSTKSTFTSTTFLRDHPEAVDLYDGAGQMAVASERIRRYVTPQDPVGVGRVVNYMTRPGGEKRLRQRSRHPGSDQLLSLLPTAGDAPRDPLSLHRPLPAESKLLHLPLLHEYRPGWAILDAVPGPSRACVGLRHQPHAHARPLEQPPPRLPGDAHARGARNDRANHLRHGSDALRQRPFDVRDYPSGRLPDHHQFV